GQVAMYGRSYLGATQWLAALAKPPSLRAIAPGVTASNYYEGWTYQGGAFQLAFALAWAAYSLSLGNFGRLARTLDDAAAQRARLWQAVHDLPAAWRFAPLRAWPVLERLAPYYYEWLDHPAYDDYWRRTAIKEHYGRLDLPTFNYGGWFDVFAMGTVENFAGMRGQAPGHGRDSRLLMGPWSHTTLPQNYLGERHFGALGSADAIDLDGWQLRFFDYWLKGMDDGWSEEPPVRLFVMGANTWRSEHEWPLARTEWTRWYLHSGGRANTAEGDGVLSPEPPGPEPPDVFLYDPRDPVPTCGGAVHVSFPGVLPSGPLDQRAIERRSDVLVYTSAPLPAELEVTGPVEAVIWAITSAADTDFTAKLVDVFPDGRAVSVVDGIVRARYRDSLTEARPVPPGEPQRYVIRLGPTSVVFGKGHRIRLEISSSNFPRFDRNWNVFEPVAGLAAGRPAVQTVLHEPAYPSHVVLPVIPCA
ncbi:MAG TPA: CocE/NonD family hydrolase, partial [Bacillota bacterium]